MKKIYLAAVLGALAVGTAQADDEIHSGVLNPGNFAPVQQGVSQWRRDPNAGGFSSSLTNPGNFAPVAPHAYDANDALEVSKQRSFDEIFSGVENPVASGKNTASAQAGSQEETSN